MQYPEFQNIKVVRKDKIATVMLSRPEQRNSWTEEMRCEIVEAISILNRDTSIRAIVLTGDPKGKAFCAGASLSGGKLGGDKTSSKNDVDVPEGRKVDGTTFRDGGGVAGLALLRCTKPVIAALNGPAVGVGLTLPMCCDMRVAAHDSKVGFVFARRGLACETISSWLLPRIIGMGKAMELVLTGRVFKTQDAPAGLFNYVVPASEVLPKAMELAKEIADNTSAMSVVLSRWALLRNANLTPEEAHLSESRMIHFTVRNKDSREGIMSFLEKRKPDFQMDPFSDLPDFVPWWKQVSTDSKL